MTPAETDTPAVPEVAPEAAEPTEAPAAPQVAEPEEAAAPPEPTAPAETAPEQTEEAETPSAPQVAEAETPAEPEAPRAPRPNRQADRRKQLEELSRSTAAELGREPDRRLVEKAILSAGGPDAVREFLATPQESREGKPLGWRIACLREARRHEPGGKAETGWVTLSAVPVRQIRNALDRAVDADGRIMFRDEPVDTGRGGGPGGRPGARGGQGGRPGGGQGRGGRRPRGDDRAIADEFLQGGVASFGESSGRKNPFAALSGLLDEDDAK